jgi:hypothetical protein
MPSGDLSAPAVFPKKQLIARCDSFGKVRALPDFRNHLESARSLVSSHHRYYACDISRVFHRLVMMKVAVSIIPDCILRLFTAISG